MAFPQRRLRRLRRTPALRRLVAETRLGVDDLVAPLFVREGIDEPQPIASLPGVVQHTRESLRKEVARAGRPRHPRGRSCSACPAHKDAEGSGAWDPDGIVQVALARPARRGRRRRRAHRRPVPRRVHRPRPLRRRSTPTARSTTTPPSSCYARGRGRPGRGRRRHRRALRDDGRPGRAPSATPSTATGHERRAILAYAAKYASALYGPFRDAVDVDDRRRRRPQGLPAGPRATPARRWRRSAPTSPRAPTSSW